MKSILIGALALVVPHLGFAATTCEADISLLNKAGAAIKAKNNVHVDGTDTKTCVEGTATTAHKLCAAEKGGVTKLPQGKTIDKGIVSFKATVKANNETVQIPVTPCK